MRLYLAGPMRGYPRWNFDAFERGASALRSAGFEVASPAETDLANGFDPDAPAELFTREHLISALLRDAELVLHSDGVALMEGWRDSKGAMAERALGRAVGIPVRPVSHWLNDGPTPQEGTNE
ncbi:nucleoside deoxyribosyltransferase [Arthrobacter phage DrManhattan]|uniref:Nucleoside deoxyribosyltransferase n=1 Tax=Arthrobacter phage DrManhattan TaxID=2419955 RepID=A0A3G2KFI4_9CAUD|nr:nucleoside 2-deoxyribosyltransferase [Arthrobacter phage DrManhattan]AYN57746.1 nucleoside deoxyribosyltransferase [Arthrobacter phage DrManhattan]